jgi:diguanylate cyclase (GGDEF)-like protein
MHQTLKTTPAMAAIVAIMVGFVAAVQFSVPTWQNYGIGSLYLWPVTLVALWFGVRVAIGLVGVVMLLQVAWFAAVPHHISAGVGATSLVLRGATYVFVSVVVGEFAHRLRGVAFTDPLTKLPNRRAFFDEVERRSRTSSVLGIVACDVDGLKQINDARGHGAGDDAIITVGHALEALLGESGFVCRVGGDEFLALTSPELATQIAAMHDPIHGARLGTSLHSTIGSARIDVALAGADVSLYRAKHRLVVASEADALPDAA